MFTFSFIFRLTRQWTSLKGFLSLGFIHFQIGWEARKDIPEIQAHMIRQRMMEKDYTLDSTKRKSLQPGNMSVPIPGWRDRMIAPPSKQRIANHTKATPPLENTFIHDFFGSQLMVGDMQIGQGLSKGKHRLEITQDQLRIDNVPQVINQGELERIKEIIRESRA
jgi:hypothetical protein